MQRQDPHALALGHHALREQPPIEEPPPWFFERVHLAIGQGNPDDHDHHALGIDIERRAVSNRAYHLALKRDGSTRAARDRMLTGREYNEVLKLPEIEAWEKKYLA